MLLCYYVIMLLCYQIKIKLISKYNHIMDYQQKYLKYKLKYLNLKTKLIGGAYHVFPIERIHAAYGSEPHTSWFFMPLIYWGHLLVS